MNEIMKREGMAPGTRTAEVIAGEINQIKSEVRDTVIRAAIEIGKRLREAKSLVPYGQWGDWLAENVDYSERTAQNYMAIADEYGQKETQALAQIRSKEQAILLLALDEREREAFVQQHDLGAMSTRELKEELERVKAERDKLQLTMDEMLGHAQDKPDAEGAIVLASAEETEAEWEALNAERERLEERRREMEAAMREAQAAKAQAAAEKERAGDLEKSLMEARKQVDETEKRRQLETKQEIDARKKAQEQHEQQQKEARREIDDLRAQLEAARAEVKTVEVVPEAVEKELQALRAKAARGGVEQELHSLFAMFRQDFSRLVDKLDEAEESGQTDLAAKYRAAFAKATTVMAGRLEK